MDYRPQRKRYLIHPEQQRIIEPAQRLVEILAHQLKSLLGAIKRYDSAIAERCAAHEDFTSST